jgi:hypothetical protein
MSKARDIADLGSNDVLDTSSSGIDVTGSVTADGATFDGYVTINDSVDLNGTVYPNSVFMQDSRAIVFGDGADVELSWAGSYLNLNTKGNDIRIMDNLDTKVIWDASTERLGIGTSSPEQKLHVEGVSVTVNNSNDDSSIAFQNSASNATWRIGRDYSNSEALSFAYTSNDYPSLTSHSKVVIDTSGNVGIGTSSPTAVSGTKVLEIIGDSGSAGAEVIIGSADTAGQANDFFGGLAFKSIDTNGTAPHYSGIKAIATDSYGGASLNFYVGREQYETNDPRFVIFGDYSTTGEAMRIDSSGRVGIGTGSSIDTGVMLDVEGSATIGGTNPTYYFGGSGVSGNVGYIQKTTGSDYALTIVGSNSTNASVRAPIVFKSSTDKERMRIDTNGYVGIGTSTPNSPLHVAGWAAIDSPLGSANTWHYMLPMRIVGPGGGATFKIAAIPATGRAGDTTAVAVMDYAINYSYAGNNLSQGFCRASTRRSNNDTTWTVLEENSDYTGNAGNTRLYWVDGVLYCDAYSYDGVHCTIHISLSNHTEGLTIYDNVTV